MFIQVHSFYLYVCNWSVIKQTICTEYFRAVKGSTQMFQGTSYPQWHLVTVSWMFILLNLEHEKVKLNKFWDVCSSVKGVICSWFVKVRELFPNSKLLEISKTLKQAVLPAKLMGKIIRSCTTCQYFRITLGCNNKWTGIHLSCVSGILRLWSCSWCVA